MDETMDETFVEEEVMEISGMDEEEEGADLDEEIDLEEILNELELEEGTEAEDDEDEIEEAVGKPNYKADYVQDVMHKADDINGGLNEGESFDLDALLEEINNLDETEDEVNEYVEPTNRPDTSVSALGVAGIVEQATLPGGEDAVDSFDAWMKVNPAANDAWQNIAKGKFNEGMYETVQAELEETQAALETVRTELNEVNLLNSKLLYVNRIFKANTLDQGQKLRVVETLDKAETAKEAKLIYETIKDTFTVANNKKRSFQTKTKSLKEGIGMASRAAGTSTAPKKEVITESDNMVSRFQKLANIKIN
jgi:hypothetical protein